MTVRESPGRASKTVLIVDDNAAHARIAQQVLELAGYTCACADTGEEAIERIAAAPPDLVLMDLFLPGMSGLEAARQLKATPATAAIPIIAITSHRQAFSVDEATRAGVEAYIAKPFHYADLIELAGKLLARKTPAAGSWGAGMANRRST